MASLRLQKSLQLLLVIVRCPALVGLGVHGATTATTMLVAASIERLTVNGAGPRDAKIPTPTTAACRSPTSTAMSGSPSSAAAAAGGAGAAQAGPVGSFGPCVWEARELAVGGAPSADRERARVVPAAPRASWPPMELNRPRAGELPQRVRCGAQPAARRQSSHARTSVRPTSTSRVR